MENTHNNNHFKTSDPLEDALKKALNTPLPGGKRRKGKKKGQPGKKGGSVGKHKK